MHYHHERPDLIDRDIELPTPADERQALYIGAAVDALPTALSRKVRQPTRSGLGGTALTRCRGRTAAQQEGDKLLVLTRSNEVSAPCDRCLRRDPRPSHLHDLFDVDPAMTDFDCLTSTLLHTRGTDAARSEAIRSRRQDRVDRRPFFRRRCDESLPIDPQQRCPGSGRLRRCLA